MHLSSALKCQGLVVCSIPFIEPYSPAPYGAVQFSMFGPLSTHFLNYVREISLVQDGARWHFTTTGTEQDFEEPGAYSRRRVTDRFNLPMLIRYCEALGLQPFEEDFLSRPLDAGDQPQPGPPEARLLSLAETRKWLHIHSRG
ncbi:hypothetical protein SAMN04487913_101360 [Arthrobacter sp. ok362]|nr:hypothetical protein SAMN04487913_101360 [Arthrobacter sp. ok362]